MRVIAVGSAALALMLGACGQAKVPQQNGPETNVATAPAASGENHSATGDVTEVTEDSVTISHAPVESAGWPAMTMTFTASPELANSVKVGDPVSFSFKERNGKYVLTSIRKS